MCRPPKLHLTPPPDAHAAARAQPAKQTMNVESSYKFTMKGARQQDCAAKKLRREYSGTGKTGDRSERRNDNTCIQNLVGKVTMPGCMALPSVTSITRVAQLSERNQLNRMCRRRLHCFMPSNLVGLHATDIDQRVVKTDHGASSSRTEPEELGGAVELV